MNALLRDYLPDESDPSSDVLLGRFLDYVGDKGLALYPAQEEAVLELFDGKNVVLNTPTGSGKSLVASAMLFAAIARGARAVYTCPIKALVNEKWMALCREFGPELVGLATGDASVNRDAPILCCTAEILANIGLREGAGAPVDHAVLDEFHWYADRDRGVGLAGAAADAGIHAVPADVGHAGRHRVLRGGADPPERPAQRLGPVVRPAGAARLLVLGDPARAHAREARGRGQGARLRRPLHPGRGGVERAGLHQPEDLQQGGEGGARGAGGRLRLRQPVRAGYPQVAEARHRPASRGPPARSTACSSSSSRSADC